MFIRNGVAILNYIIKSTSLNKEERLKSKNLWKLINIMLTNSHIENLNYEQFDSISNAIFGFILQILKLEI